MEATTPKRGKPWALLAVLGGIGIGTVGMCGLGAWLLVHGAQTTTAAEEAARGPLVVTDETYRVLMTRSRSQDMEVYEGVLARDIFQNAILRRVNGFCDARLRVRTVGSGVDVVPWMDLTTGGTPEGESTRVAIAGIDTEATQRRYLNSAGEPFYVVGFVRGEVLYTLDIASSDITCVSDAIASLGNLQGDVTPPIAAPFEVSRPTFRIAGNRFEGFVSGLVFEAPEPFRFAPPDSRVASEYDEVVLLHPNGTELHILTTGTTERDRTFSCTPPFTENSRSLHFAGAERPFVSGPANRHWWANTWYCIDQTWVQVTAHAPSEASAVEAIEAMSAPLRRETFPAGSSGPPRRAGGAEWSYVRDRYVHFGSGLTWQRPHNVDVQFSGIARPRDNYPEPNVQFSFLRRDLTARGAIWAHRTELTGADYHTAFVNAASATHELAAPERVDEVVRVGTCVGTRTELAEYATHISIISCLQNGWAVAIEVVRHEDRELEFANEAIAALTIGAHTDAATFQVDGETVELDAACARAERAQNRLALEVHSCRSWTTGVVLAQTITEAHEEGAFAGGLNQLQLSRIFASTTPVTHTDVSGVPAEERRIVIRARELRVYTVVVDATAYVISMLGPASTPEAEWSELLATVHIDP